VPATAERSPDRVDIYGEMATPVPHATYGAVEVRQIVQYD
jgi:hypothetical protein